MEVEKIVEREVPVEVIKEVPVEVEVIKEIQVPVEVIKEVIKEVPVEIIKEVPGPERIVYRDPEPQAISMQEDQTAQINFGTKFPANPRPGDTFMRVDTNPNTTYRFNGQAWVRFEAPARDVDQLTRQVLAGQLELKDLSDVEQTEVRNFLKKEHVLGR